MEKIVSSFIRKRSNKYHVYVEYINEDGKKKQRSEGSFKNKKEAEKLLIDVKNKINNDNYIMPKNITFTNRCYQYYNDKTQDLAETTIFNQKLMVKKHIASYWDDTKLCDITINKYQVFVNSIYSLNIATNTKKHIISIANAVLNECYRCREIPNKIPDFIRIPKSIKPDEVSIYSIDEVKYILEKSKNKKPAFEIVMNLFAYGGLRKGEALGLTWDNVDFENNTIYIKNNLQYISGKCIMKTTKTDSSIRSVALPPIVMDLLRKEKLRQNKLKLQGLMSEKEYDTVCISKKTYYYVPISFYGDYIKFINEIGLEYKKPHALRHAHVSMLIAAGVDVKTISQRVGHSSSDITLQVYAHVFTENDKKAADKINTILGQ